MNLSTSATIRTLGLAFLLSLTLFSLPALSATPDLRGVSRSGLQVNLYSRLQPLQLNTMHSWEIELLDDSGAPVAGATMEVEGGMPEHDHGLPTSPQVTGTLPNGRYLLEGMRFHMPGKWLLRIALDADGKSEIVEINFEL